MLTVNSQQSTELKWHIDHVSERMGYVARHSSGFRLIFVYPLFGLFQSFLLSLGILDGDVAVAATIPNLDVEDFLGLNNPTFISVCWFHS